MNHNQILMLLESGQTKRYHTQLTLKDQSVAEHSHHVALLCYAITYGKPSAQLLMAALTHDLGERKVGDMPSPTKRATPAVYACVDELEAKYMEAMGYEQASLNGYEKSVLALADVMDGLFFCWRELRLGNRHLMDCYGNYTYFALEIKRGWEHSHDLPSAVVELIGFFTQEYSNAS